MVFVYRNHKMLYGSTAVNIYVENDGIYTSINYPRLFDCTVKWYVSDGLIGYLFGLLFGELCILP